MNELRPLGHVLLWVGFFAAAFIAVRSAEDADDKWSTISWPAYSVAFAVGTAGVVVLRRTAKGANRQDEERQADLGVLETSLVRITEKLAGAIDRREEIGVYSVYHWIDDELAELLGDFVGVRETLIKAFGLQQYANVMTQFAVGERNINRAWSASVDGYVDEVWASLDRAQGHLAAALALLRKCKAEAKGESEEAELGDI